MIKVKNVIGGGPDQEWAAVELGAEAECIDGETSLELRNTDESKKCIC